MDLRVQCDEHGRVREIWLRVCAGPVCEQGPGLSVRERVRACACVSSRARACPCASVSSEYASVSLRERVCSRPPEEGEVSHPITGIGLGVMPVGPHTPRRSVLTSSRWTDPNPSSSAAGATLHHVESEVVIPAAWRTPALPTSAL